MVLSANCGELHDPMARRARGPMKSGRSAIETVDAPHRRSGGNGITEETRRHGGTEFQEYEDSVSPYRLRATETGTVGVRGISAPSVIPSAPAKPPLLHQSALADDREFADRGGVVEAERADGVLADVLLHLVHVVGDDEHFEVVGGDGAFGEHLVGECE